VTTTTPDAPPPTRPTGLPPRSLGDLADQLGLPCPVPSRDVLLSGVTHASGSAQPGDLYVAIPGARTHGARFAADAASRGARAVLTDPTGARLAEGSGLPTLLTHDPRAVLGAAAAFVYGAPGEDVTVIGVTGTNGKTTVTSLLHAVLTELVGSAGLVGTIETRIGDAVVPSVRTTPEASDLQAILAVLRERAVPACAIEVSSHALALGRVGGLVVDVAGFTNLSQDHQDFHPDMEHYFQTKASLFTPQHARRAVVVVDDSWGRRLAAQATVPVRTLAVVPDEPQHPVVLAADWSVRDIVSAGAHSRAVLVDPEGRQHHLQVPMPGVVNVVNGALTVALATECGLSTEEAVRALAAAPMVAGRMEVVSGPAQPVVVVDYAHSPDAIDTALATLRAGDPSPLVVVLGAGGDRDRSKRGPMGAAAARGADLVIVTDDNPRSEAPERIRAAVLAGAREVAAERVHEVPDRAEAIARAIRLAGPAGTVLVAGKGHEQGQEVAGVVHPFDDRVVARAALAAVDDDARPAGGDG
jgi:UDP-N-acetylmuramoyl-L-alanyl-D-glutamate--2,6-diaminopimelate ligase